MPASNKAEMTMYFSNDLNPLMELVDDFNTLPVIYIYIGHESTLDYSSFIDALLRETPHNFKLYLFINPYMHESPFIQKLKNDISFTSINYCFRPSGNFIATKESVFISNEYGIFIDEKFSDAKGFISKDTKIINKLISPFLQILNKNNLDKQSVRDYKGTRFIAEIEYYRNQLTFLIREFEKIVTKSYNVEQSYSNRETNSYSLDNWSKRMLHTVNSLQALIADYKASNPGFDQFDKDDGGINELNSLLTQLEINISNEEEPFTSKTLHNPYEEIGYNTELIEEYSDIYSHLIGMVNDNINNSDNYMTTIEETLDEMKKTASSYLKAHSEVHEKIAGLIYYLNRTVFSIKCL
ncbi:hypothetical protein [Alkalicoccus saliphilus]|uniref:Uncharacterized protein n=1 Tax=Alkalicoccus saliphilus TaxID=200989 RepID=A0A2T4U782_9BACI|nr:hypothetical protein [Alkalicoccus saliphilus]PTL39232.1 hypothetical protein C6Y45_07525 [Alkalicoccus saliphilus]